MTQSMRNGLRKAVRNRKKSDLMKIIAKMMFQLGTTSAEVNEPGWKLKEMIIDVLYVRTEQNSQKFKLDERNADYYEIIALEHTRLKNQLKVLIESQWGNFLQVP